MATPSWLRYANAGATRNQALDPRLIEALGFLGDMGVTAEVFSGGQPSSGPNRVGSHRHDHGGAGDMHFYQGGRKLDWANEADRPVFEEIVKRGKAAGVTGMGAGPGYMSAGSMHLGFGSPSVWGAGGQGANAPDWLRNAYNGAPAGTAPASPYAAMAHGPKGQESYAPSPQAQPQPQEVQVAQQDKPPQGVLDLLKGAGKRLSDNNGLLASLMEPPAAPQMAPMQQPASNMPSLPDYIAQFLNSRRIG